MSEERKGEQLDAATIAVETILDAVIARGHDEKPELIDDYGVMIASFESRKLVTFQLYDSYFPPKRHEFELQLLTTLVDAIAANSTATFLGGAVVGGVVGNAAYDVLKHLLSRIISKSKPIKRTHAAFKDIETNLEQIVVFFEKRKEARVVEICEAMDIGPDKVEPLLKLLGFSCRKKGKHRIWTAPDTFRTGGRRKRM